jgi:nicotinate-nucleotide pyrophosphorylase (carboxylating)
MKLSSIATSTADFVARIRPISPTLRLATTRKTTPGFGWFEKKAVFLGGGDTHRWNLSDMVMFKDTHLKFYDGDPLKLLTAAKKVVSFSKKIEIEIEKPEDIPLAIQGGADIIMLDNMSPSQIQTVLDPLKKHYPHILFEASGNITLENIESYAKSGVDIISTSAVVFYPHKPMDFSLRLQD